jgi:hypothetical protein
MPRIALPPRLKASGFEDAASCGDKDELSRSDAAGMGIGVGTRV